MLFFKRKPKYKNFQEFSIYDYVVLYCQKYDKDRTTVLNILANNNISLFKKSLQVSEILEIEEYIKSINIGKYDKVESINIKQGE